MYKYPVLITIAFYHDTIDILITRIAGIIDGLVQERRNSSALAMELRLSCINPSLQYNIHRLVSYKIWQPLALSNKDRSLLHWAWTLNPLMALTMIADSLFNPVGAENGYSERNRSILNTVAADALAPCVARPSAAMVLTVQD